MLSPAITADDAADDREHAAAGPARDDLARLLAEPAAWPTTWPSSALSKSATCGPNLGRSSGSMKPVVADRWRRRSSATSSAGPVGRRALRWRCASVTASPGGGRDVDADLRAPSPRMPGSSRNAISPREARSSIAVVRARRDVPPSMTIAPEAAVRSGGGAGMRIDGSSR